MTRVVPSSELARHGRMDPAYFEANHIGKGQPRRPKPGPYADLDHIKTANAQAGQHYFSRDTMRFFRSRIGDTVYAGRYFITSEQFVDSGGRADPRRYSIRVALDNGHVEQVGEFQQFGSRTTAQRALTMALEKGLEIRFDGPPNPDPSHYHWQVYLGDLPVHYLTDREGAEALLEELAE